MSIYNKQRDGDWVTTKQTEIPIYGSDRLGLVRRDLVLTKGAVCEGCGEPKEDPIAASELRIIELNHDSPLTAPNAKTEVNLGEYIVLKNTSGRNLALGDVQVGQGEDWWQFSASDTIEPNAYALICYGTSADQTEFLSANNLPTTLTSDASVQWHWQNTVTFADVEGQTAIRLYENGKPGATLDQVYWNPDGLQAINAYCDATCQADPNREAVNSLQLDDFTYDPINPWDESKWTTSEATAKGKGTSQPEAPSAIRSLLKKEYELKDHLGNVQVVVTDRKHSLVSGLAVGEFKADVVVMRDYYPGACPERSRRGMEMEGQGYAAGDYRYGFNGMERDDEVKGSGDSYDFGARMFDPRVGRWMSRDPLAGKYVGVSSYTFVNNMPIVAIDPDGMKIILVGSPDAIQRFVSILNLRTGGGFEVIDNVLSSTNPDLKIETSSEVSAKLRSLAIFMTEEMDETQTYEIVEGKDDMAFDDFKTGEIDVNDFEAAGEAPDFQAAMIGHVLGERKRIKNYDIEKKNASLYNDAHIRAIYGEELEILNEMVPDLPAIIGKPMEQTLQEFAANDEAKDPRVMDNHHSRKIIGQKGLSLQIHFYGKDRVFMEFGTNAKGAIQSIRKGAYSELIDNNGKRTKTIKVDGSNEN